MVLQSIDHYITYSVITSEPQLNYSSVVSTVRAFPITSGKHEGQTFVTWTGNFSSDADASTLFSGLFVRAGTDQPLGVIQDAKYKRREALQDLAQAAAKK